MFAHFWATAKREEVDAFNKITTVTPGTSKDRDHYQNENNRKERVQQNLCRSIVS